MSGLGSYHEQDYYQLLEVAQDATKEEIQSAYERLKGVFEESSSATFMLFGGDEAASMRTALEEAYQTLSDERKRERYDNSIGVKREGSSSSAVNMTHATSITSTTSPIVDARIIADQRAEQRADQRPDVRQPERQIEARHEEPKPEPKTIAASTPPEREVAELQAQQQTVSAPPPESSPMVVSPPVLDANMEFSGGVLMRLRESKGISLEQIAQRTKISMTHLRAIEANQYDKLPARVYVRGFVSQYAKFLSLPADRVCDSYLQIYDRFVQAKVQ